MRLYPVLAAKIGLPFLLFTVMACTSGSPIGEREPGAEPSAPAPVIAETDPLVLAKLETWRDWKFGLLMHWGPYSQWGVVESWSICSEDEGWCRRNTPNYVEYKAQYEALKKTFNPKNFNPSLWARAAKDAGMRYMVFTTKHHDGFCMFDTETTDYKVTDPGCAFGSDPRANLTRGIFDAFREQGLGIGAYFSKPDWHSPDYWWPNFATPDRHVNYDPARYPKRWKAFQDHTYRQIEELMTDYGPVDILWLDGAWVRPIDNMPAEYESWGRKKDWNQDVDIPSIAKMARRRQPGLIVVDRWVAGRYENYLTPEQKIPDKPLDEPWEACMTMGHSWSYTPTDKMKSTHELVQLLVQIVAKGGNLLLNIGVSPTGEYPPDAYDRLRDIGAWMKINSRAIYGTRPVAPYRLGKFCFTQAKTGEVFSLYLTAKDEKQIPPEIRIPVAAFPEVQALRLLGSEDKLRAERVGDWLRVAIPNSLRERAPGKDVWVFELQKPLPVEAGAETEHRGD